MKKHSLTSSISRVALIAVGIMAVTIGATRARADVFDVVFDEQLDGLHGMTWKNGNLIQDVNVGPESYAYGYGLQWNYPSALASNVDLRFNIWDDANHTILSDTWHLFGSQGDGTLQIPFISEATTPLAGAIDITETGAYQYVASMTLDNGDVFNWGFRSGPANSNVPDTGSGVLGLLTLVGLCVVGFRRQSGLRVL